MDGPEDLEFGFDPHGRIRVKKVEPALMVDTVKQVHARRHRGGFTGLVGSIDDVRSGAPAERSPKSMTPSVNLP
jgi:hypothetical protein